ncbi:Ig-like domain-containing protein [Pontibacter pudoricolor]|uniref:Ig-like domain-containing protein n=1 Tax=Pontibacter pudoricolor TaxID=2694930 RepID=UPI001391907C|nr:Ig-like domain-containing protein [Pontibacter pudoricolor]
MKFINTVFLATSVIALASCASVSSPEGGPKDTTPPTLVSSTPADQQLNVSTKTISLKFDEEVQQNNLQKELLITPYTDNKYRIKMDDEVLILTFDKPLQDSTTYTFNFRNGIADIKEKTVAKGLKLSFSTGSFIDTSRVTGQVLKLMTQEPEADAIVALYPAEDTMNIRKSRPYYQTQADAQGQFSFENIREGNYRIYALQDKNNNTLYDNEGERIGFLKDPITIKADSQKVTLQTFIIDTKKPIALQRQKMVDRFTITYSEGLEKINAVTATRKDTIYHKTLPDGKTVELFKNPKFTGGKALVAAVDSSGNNTLDTIQVDFGQDYTQRIKGAEIKDINKKNANTLYRPGQKLTIELQAQVTIKGKSPVTIQSDTATSIVLKYPEEIKLDKTATELTITIPKLSNRQAPYTIVLDSTQIVPMQGKPLSFPTLNFTIGENKGTGSVQGTIATTAKSFIVQLLDSNYKVVKESKNTRSFKFQNMEPGVYNIRVLVDENNNGQWDKGTATFDREPERVYMYPNKVEIRANWELEDIKIEL